MRAITFRVSDDYLAEGLQHLVNHGNIGAMTKSEYGFDVTVVSRQFPDGPDATGYIVCSKELSPDGMTYTFKTTIKIEE